MSTTDVDFNLPTVIKDFLFDLHDAVRRSARVDEVQRLYDAKFKEITDKYFSQAPWPESKVIASEVGNDEGFLVFYRSVALCCGLLCRYTILKVLIPLSPFREMAMRHVTTKLKPQVADHINSWRNYVKLFETVLTAKEEDLSISTQWAYDIVQEFVYQFQGFCQYRSQISNQSSNAEVIKVLEANRDAWNLPEVVSILKRLIRAAKSSSSAGKNTPFNAGPSIAQFGYFATIELARLECLTGDFTASLATIAAIKLSDRSELFAQLPLCHFNVFYHTGVCHLLLRKFSTAADVLSEIILHVSRVLKPGAVGSLRAGLQTQLQRALDKAVALTAIATFLSPGHRLDDQVKEIVDAKYADKIQKLNNAESLQKVLTDLFDFSAPKFVSPSVPDYSVAVNSKQEVINHIFTSFLAEVEQHQAFFKLKSFLGLYATIELDKLARFNDIVEADLVCQLVSAKNKSVQQRNGSSSQRGDVHYFVDAGAVIIDSSSAKAELAKAQERFFVAGVRKHAEIAAQINKSFAAVGLE